MSSWRQVCFRVVSVFWSIGAFSAQGNDLKQKLVSAAAANNFLTMQAAVYDAFFEGDTDFLAIERGQKEKIAQYFIEHPANVARAGWALLEFGNGLYHRNSFERAFSKDYRDSLRSFLLLHDIIKVANRDDYYTWIADQKLWKTGKLIPPKDFEATYRKYQRFSRDLLEQEKLPPTLGFLQTIFGIDSWNTSDANKVYVYKTTGMSLEEVKRKIRRYAQLDGAVADRFFELEGFNSLQMLLFKMAESFGDMVVRGLDPRAAIELGTYSSVSKRLVSAAEKALFFTDLNILNFTNESCAGLDPEACQLKLCEQLVTIGRKTSCETVWLTQGGKNVSSVLSNVLQRDIRDLSSEDLCDLRQVFEYSATSIEFIMLQLGRAFITRVIIPDWT